ncbi:MAG TPA: hypothetical protein VH143_19495 [Kofleriaceae bacterium]|jgi:hypothetical protein|nr:hypothetical protein [Kofleriaceae bacterium]
MRGLPIVLAAVVGCAYNVSQDKATGKDGRIAGAKPIALDDGGEGTARGIVTYPGGDRVDWKSIALPDDKHGTLELAMTYTTPRPKLHVAFDVFDRYNTPVKLAVQHKRHHGNDATIENAKGTYFVRVYAPGRGDAGTYKLVAHFTPTTAAVVPVVEIPDPPKLAAVPPPEEPCDHFDSRNKACGDQCPSDAPEHWPGCANTCRAPDVNNEVCRKTMACPAQPDRRVDDCMRDAHAHWPTCADWAHPDPNNPLCDPQYRKPVTATILNMEQQGTDVIVTISIGTSNNIDASWGVHVLIGNSDRPIANGTAKIIRVEKTRLVARVHLTLDQVSGNQRVVLSPPGT